jgi:biotin carboxyl carrier protein
LARRTGLRPGPILIYIGVVAVIVAGLLAWDAAWKRREEAARKPPPADVLAKNLVENIIGRNTVKTVTVDETKGTVEVTFESATYPPAARATVAGEVLPRLLDRLTAGAPVSKGDPLVYVKNESGAEVIGARADQSGKVVQLLVKSGDKVEENRAVVLIEPTDKTEARQNLETEGLLAWQAITSQLSQIKTVTSRIVYKDITVATVVGVRGQKVVTTTYHESLK